MSPPRDAIYFGSRDAVVRSKRRSWAGARQVAAVHADVSQFGAGGGLVAYTKSILNGEAASAPGAYFDVYHRAVQSNRRRLSSRRWRWHLSVRRRSYCYFLAWWVTACARSFIESRSPESNRQNSARFLNSRRGVAFQITNAAHGNCGMRKRQHNRYSEHRCHRSNQGYGL
jgi:hypothetical protein